MEQQQSQDIVDNTPSTEAEMKTDAPQGNMYEAMSQFRAQKRGEKVEELPRQTLPQEEAPVEAAPAEAAQSEDAPAEVAKAPVKIKIGDRVFENESDAFDYAQELEREKLIAQAHEQGIREALQSMQQNQQQPEAQEDDWESKFYQNPRQAIEQAKEQAKQEALQVIQQENARERAWQEFSSEYPDLADYRGEVERTLRDNWDVYGKISDEAKAKKLLATQVRQYFDRIAEARKPKRELPQARDQVVSPGRVSQKSVTQKQKTDVPLTFVEQMKMLRKTRK